MSLLRRGVLRLLAGLPLFLAAGAVWAADGEQVLKTVCAGCHAALPNGGLARIDEMRKTPEGWEMTVTRMQVAHGVALSDDDKAAVIKLLADRAGLAPSETTPYRAFLEHRPDAKDAPPTQELAEVCSRCHSFARVGLQHRDTAEWVKHANFHLGQYPSAEYSDKGRDREWWRIASTEIPPKLGELLPLVTPAWTDWQKRPHPALAGTWRVVGHTPGRGDYQGRMVLSAGSAADSYSATLDLTYRDGKRESGKGAVVLYTGYEWRGQFTVGKDTIRQVLALGEDGAATGRWFDAERDERGGDLSAVLEQPGAARVLAVSPGHLRAGETAEIEIDGIGLSGFPSLGDGVTAEVLANAPDRMVVRATAAATAGDGLRTVQVGGARLEGGLAVYHKIDEVRITPGDAIARLGGNGPFPAVAAQFEAVGYLAAANGDPAKAIRIGVFPAQWSVAGFDAVAEQLKDAHFAGTITPTGEFEPAGAGPNKERHFGTNNAGNLKVTGTVSDGGQTVAGSAHLVVTVERWIKPEIL